MQTASSDPGVRCVLEGVPRVGFYEPGPRAPEDDQFPSCIRAFLEWKNDDVGFRKPHEKGDFWHDIHMYVMGTSGAAFRIPWDRGFSDRSTGSIFAMGPDALEPVRRAFESVGYEYEVLLRKEFAAKLGITPAKVSDEAAFRSRIVESIRQNKRPVIAIGVIGPPEPCLITGYDEGGDVLLGWNSFQKDPANAAGVQIEPSGYFRKKDWFKDTQGLILIGDKRPLPPTRETVRKTLKYGLQLMRTPLIRGVPAGQAAFTEWADAVLKDSNMPKDKPQLVKQRAEYHHDTAGLLAEARAWGSNALRMLGEREPLIENEMRLASKCFDDEHDLVWAIWEFATGMNVTDKAGERFLDSGTRGRIAPLIRLCRTRDAEAADHMEKALRILADSMAKGPVPRNSKAQVKREGGKVRIEAVPSLKWGGGHDCTYIGALAAATSVTEHPQKYEDLMGATGLAFRVRWSNPTTKGGWDMSCPCGEFMEEWDDSQTASGWRLIAEIGELDGSPSKEAVARRVIASIDAGWPVLAPAAGPDVGLIYGYADGGKTFLVRSYGKPEPGIEVPAKVGAGGFQLMFAFREDPLPARESFLAGLRTAVRNWRRDKTSAGYAAHGNEWFYGKQAMKVWTEDLKRDLAAMPEKDRQAFFDLNHFNYFSLVDARKAAIRYLAGHARLLEGDAAKALERAAQLYEREVAVLEPLMRANAPWAGPEPHLVSEWTAAQRAKEHDVLLEATKLNGGAVEEIEKAVHLVDSAARSASGHGVLNRAVLPGVPKIGFGIHLSPLPGSLFSVMQYLGDPVDYDYLMGVSGACFRRIWSRDDGGNVDLMYLAPEPYRRIEEAIGYELAPVPHDRDRMLAGIRDSIRRGRPVIGFGIIGPPEAGIITGFDRDGGVLYGWSYFQDGALPGYYEQTDWFEKTASGRHQPGLLVVGDKDRWWKPDRRKTLITSLRWAIDLARTAERANVPDHVCGLAAYEEWARGLEVDADYPKDDVKAMGWRIMIHGDQCVMLEERHSAAKYLRMMAPEAPEAADSLKAAADLYDQVGDLVGKVYPWGSDMGPAAQQGLAVPATRREIAKLVRDAGAKEAQAVKLLEKALAAIDAKAPSR